jgi:hypothetical protein
MTTIVSRQAVDDCLQGAQARCEVCHRPIEVVKGHRTRRYCSDTKMMPAETCELSARLEVTFETCM